MICFPFVVKLDTTCPYNVSLVKTSINVVWATFLQSSGIVAQRKPALIVLVQKQLSILEEHIRLWSYIRLWSITYLLVLRQWPVLLLVLLHPILRAVDDGRCWKLRFIVDSIFGSLQTRQSRWHGFGSLLQGPWTTFFQLIFKSGESLNEGP
jgi:hypothetical protein